MTLDAFSRYQRIFLSLTVITTIGAVALCYLQLSEWRAVTTEADKLAQELDNPDRLRREVSEVRNATVTTRLALAHLELNLPTRDYVPTMLRELELMGKASGLRITGVRPVEKQAKPKPVDQPEADKPGKPKNGEKQKEERKPYEELDFEIQATGHFAQGLDFLQKVSGFPKIIAVRTVSISATPNPRDTGPPKLTFSFGVRAYIFPAKRADLAQEPKPTPTGATDGG